MALNTYQHNLAMNTPTVHSKDEMADLEAGPSAPNVNSQHPNLRGGALQDCCEMAITACGVSFLFAALLGLFVAVAAAQGVIIAAVGAAANHSPITSEILIMGAKAGMVAFALCIGLALVLAPLLIVMGGAAALTEGRLASIHVVFLLLLINMVIPVVWAVTVSAAISHLILGEVSKALIIASIPTGLLIRAAVVFRDGLGTTFVDSQRAESRPCGSWLLSWILYFGVLAVCGPVFVAVARNHGFPPSTCSLSAAAAASVCIGTFSASKVAKAGWSNTETTTPNSRVVENLLTAMMY